MPRSTEGSSSRSRRNGGSYHDDENDYDDDDDYDDYDDDEGSFSDEHETDSLVGDEENDRRRGGGGGGGGGSRSGSRGNRRDRRRRRREMYEKGAPSCYDRCCGCLMRLCVRLCCIIVFLVVAVIGGFILYEKSQGNDPLEEFKAIVTDQTGMDIDAVSAAISGGIPPTTAPAEKIDSNVHVGGNIDDLPDRFNDFGKEKNTGCDEPTNDNTTSSPVSVPDKYEPVPVPVPVPVTVTVPVPAGPAESLIDMEALEKLLLDEGGVNKHVHPRRQLVRYDPSATLQEIYPFDFTLPQTYGSNVLSPPLLFDPTAYYEPKEQDYLGYFRHPDIMNNHLVFCTEGDIFVTRLPDATDEGNADDGSETEALAPLHATKLTTTVGNVLDPQLHPSLRFLAYTATYSGRRDVYLMDLQGGQSPAMRLTYWDVSFGVSGLIGWWGNSLIFRALSNDVSLPDYRLYVLNLDNLLPESDNDRRKVEQEVDDEDDADEDEAEDDTPRKPDVSVLQIDPIPLSQAIDAARYNDCWYFVRYSQSSRTIRYTGGTHEELWKYCDGDNSARQVLRDRYPGTTKSPQIYGDHHLFFLSDREKKSSSSWDVGRMNIWAIDLSAASVSFVKITDTACDFEGRVIQEFAIDSVTGHIVVRIGADLYQLKKDSILEKLNANRRLKGAKPTDNDNNNNNNQGQNNNNNSNNPKKKNNNNNNNNQGQNNKNGNNNNDKNNDDNTDGADGNDDAAGNDDAGGDDAADADGSDTADADGNDDADADAGDGNGADDNDESDVDGGDADGNDTTDADGNDDADGDGNDATDDAQGNDDADAEGDDADGNDTTDADGNDDADADAGDGNDTDGNDDSDADGNDVDADGNDVADADGGADADTDTDTDDADENDVADGEGGDNDGDTEGDDADGTDANAEGSGGTPVPTWSPAPSPKGFDSDPNEKDGENTGGDQSDGSPAPSSPQSQSDEENNGTSEAQSPSDTPTASPSDSPTAPPSPEPEDQVFYDYLPAVEEAKETEPYEDHHSGHSDALTRLPIIVHSDFSSMHERILPVKLSKHLTSADVYETTVGTFHFLMTLRGQLWVAPIADDSDSDYDGAGMNMPGRRYRLGPGSMMGGSVRILAAFHVPNPVEDESSDRRLAVILATDPLTETAEHAFYLIETQAGVTPAFLDMEHLPRPFVGGSVSGGSTQEGGLGSVKTNTITISPCGRRMAWSDTDGRILAMNLPQYQNTTDVEIAEYVVLPQENELGEPMVGDEVDLQFSPGGRYLAVNHNARNQFRVISIADLGDPTVDKHSEDGLIPAVEVDRIVQATPSRFNSENMIWGTSTMDMHVLKRQSAIASVLKNDEPDDVATTLYFTSDRDIRTTVRSPWGNRVPMPHFPANSAVYGLPLFPKTSNTTTTPADEGRFSGDGASELKVESILGRKEQVEAIMKLMKGGDKNRRRALQKAARPLIGAFGLADDTFGSRRRAEEEEEVDGNDDDDDEDLADLDVEGEEMNVTSTNETLADTSMLRPATFPVDMDIEFGPVDLTFARQAYRLSNIPEGDYLGLLCQATDDGSFVLVERDEDGEVVLKVFMASEYPSDDLEAKKFEVSVRKLYSWGVSTDREHFYLGFSPDGTYRVASCKSSSLLKLLMDPRLESNVVDADGLHLSVWPSLEYRQMYDDAWRMLRDYYYDQDMAGIDWPLMHKRYQPLVARCTKREELDDVLAQMASELSALHVFVYGGEYSSPLDGDLALIAAHQVASLGAVLKRTPEWKGYTVMSIPEPDPDFTMIDGGTTIYSPLSDATLRLSGQVGLQVGDVIVGINGESVMRVPDIHMLLRGMAGESIRLDVLRLASGQTEETTRTAEEVVEEEEDTDEEEEKETIVVAEPVITVPIDPAANGNLLYGAWEWKTRQQAEQWAEEAGFTVGYVHLRSMSGAEAEDAFARGFFPNYHKEAFILDVRHNRGGNIDSWVLDILQRKPWMYWQSRDFNTANGGLGWDEQFAFRGHLVVLMDEKTSSDGEGVSRGISELGLGRLIGTRTWGGGIWLSSDNHLVDGGIATAPEVGTYNDDYGWGLGVEQMGVSPDREVDNNPYSTFNGEDAQLKAAIDELKAWLQREPIVQPKPPEKKKDMSLGDKECRAPQAAE